MALSESSKRILNISQTKCGDCEVLDWINPSRNIREDPPRNTVAVVVDVRAYQGAIYIKSTLDEKHVDKVGPVKGEGNLVMVPWQNKWCYEPIGSVRVAYIQRKY
jgi:hypothetical protein